MPEKAVRLLALFFSKISRLITEERTKAEFRRRPGDFTRRSKFCFEKLIHYVCFRFQKTTNSELAYFYAGIDDGKNQVTRQAAFSALEKLDPYGWKHLMGEFARLFYSSGIPKRLKSFLVWAADSSSIEFPLSQEAIQRLGIHRCNHVKKESDAGKVIARCGGLLDVMNGFFVNYEIAPFKTSEHDLIRKQLAAHSYLLGQHKILVLADRGYSSLALMVTMQMPGYHFIIRGKRSDYKHLVCAMASNDEQIYIRGNKTLLNRLDDTTVKDYLEKNGGFPVRVVKEYWDDPDSGSRELHVFFTNLSPDEFTSEEVVQAYHSRWKIELAYLTLKTECEWERHTSAKVDIAFNLLYGKVFHYNLNGIIREEINVAIPEDKSLKYRYQVNEKALFAKLNAEGLLKAMYTASIEIIISILNTVNSCLHTMKMPVRPNRHYSRWGRIVSASYRYRFRIDGRMHPRVTLISGILKTIRP